MRAREPVRYLSYNETAMQLRVSVRTVRRYVSLGLLAVKSMSAKTKLVLFPFRDKKGVPFS